MKTLLSMILFLALTSCTSIDVPGFQNPTRRDWSKFERPPVGTPLTMRVFNLVGPRKYEVIDFAGKWDDGEPFIISFPITRTMDKVIRLEIHFRGEVLAAKNFKPPVPVPGGITAGWRK